MGMGDAMGCIVAPIPADMKIENADVGRFSHWAIIQTDWGLCKLLLPSDLKEDVIVQVRVFGASDPVEVTFKRSIEDAKEFVELVERRLNNTIVKHAETELQLHIVNGGRIH